MRLFRGVSEFSLVWLFLAVQCLGAAEGSNIVVEIEATSLTDPGVGRSVLQDLPGVRLRGQGVGNPQADLSIRGSSFNNAGLLLNGVSMRNAQTEHWHADLPLPAGWFNAPTVLTGLDRFRAASGHPSGSIGVELAPLLEDSRSVTLGAGSQELAFGEWSATETAALKGRTVGTAAFLSFYDIAQTDRNGDNHLTRADAGARLGAVGRRTQGDILAAISWREFGARGFYGADPAYPALERLRDTLLAGSMRFMGEPQEPAEISAVWRRTDDVYWLDRHKRDFYHNEHTTDFAAVHGKRRLLIGDGLLIDMRADGDFERIRSRSLGNHDRAHSSLSLLPGICFERLTLTAGGSFDAFSTYAPAWLPAAGLEWVFYDYQTVFVSYTGAVRQPSYTELNYESPDSLGNSGLGLQRTRTIEVGYRGDSGTAMWQITVFREDGADLADWIKTAHDTRWTAVNLSEVETVGLSAEGRTALSGTTDLGMDLLVMRKECGREYYASRYAMDYPEMDTGVSLRHRMNSSLMFILRQGLAKYAPNALRGNDDWMLDTGIDVRWHPPRYKRITINAGVHNLFNDDFQVYAGQRRAGVSLHAAVTCNW
ncbi:MAG: TonB-dependent receptor [Kiritimatiellae bacterium]|nr:TonB-dependent receptor [Kiritimatiellia bacterium]